MNYIIEEIQYGVDAYVNLNDTPEINGDTMFTAFGKEEMFGDPYFEVRLISEDCRTKFIENINDSKAISELMKSDEWNDNTQVLTLLNNYKEIFEAINVNDNVKDFFINSVCPNANHLKNDIEEYITDKIFEKSNDNKEVVKSALSAAARININDLFSESKEMTNILNDFLSNIDKEGIEPDK